MMITTEIIISD